MSTSLTIGSTLWEFDPNYRVYGSNRGAPIYAEHFRPVTVTGETPRSWLVGASERIVNKRTLQRTRNGHDPVRYYTDEGKDEAIWEHEHRSRLVRAVGFASLAQLRQIAAIFEGQK